MNQAILFPVLKHDENILGILFLVNDYQVFVQILRVCYKLSKLQYYYLYILLLNNHIENYVIPQYGDKYEDPMSNWTVEQIAGQAEKYLKRIGKNSRDGQDKLDMLKLAHCSQMIYDKIKEAKNEDRT